MTQKIDRNWVRADGTIRTVDDLGIPYTIEERLTKWQRMGLTETASGYGSALTSTRVVRLQGVPVPRRIYVTQYSNAGTAWIVYQGARYVVRG